MKFIRNKLFLRCYAEKENNQWSVYCLDFCLAAQADTYEEAKSKLINMIKDYITDATIGRDRDYAKYFLYRRAPISEWLKYYYYCVVSYFKNKDDNNNSFEYPLPLVPAC